ncbi:40S ribosomal protein S15 [Hevea brasiliensis]|nr:40S ribosomal protein S15 [Hevea brasiliensis]
MNTGLASWFGSARQAQTTKTSNPSAYRAPFKYYYYDLETLDFAAYANRGFAFPSLAMADAEVNVAASGQPKKRTFKKFSFRGVDLDALLDMSTDELVKLFHARARRRFQRGLKRKPMALIKKLRKAKREAPPGEKPEPVRTHLRNMIIVPEMIGSIIGVYNGKTFNQVEIKPEMIGHYLAEFSISYKPVKHGRPGIGATHSSRFIPLK